ncbi:achaete-scute homolog 3 [Discoglossus pictus]
MDNCIYSLPEKIPIVNDAEYTAQSCLPFCMDPTVTFHLYHEESQFSGSQDLSLLSYAPGQPIVDQYYNNLYNLPSQPICPKFGHQESYYGPSYIRKRNERERQRVKCVNEGYNKLRRHLPQEYLEKRLSKVQTLRAAIKYINHLQDILGIDIMNSTRVNRQENYKQRSSSVYHRY